MCFGVAFVAGDAGEEKERQQGQHADGGRDRQRPAAPAVKDERRVPVDAKLVVSRTRDGGASFEVLDRGLPSPSFDLIYQVSIPRTFRSMRKGMFSRFLENEKQRRRAKIIKKLLTANLSGQ